MSQYLFFHFSFHQGAVYLEDCEEEDWTFEVIEKSHIYFDEFMERTDQWRCRNVNDHDLDWFKSKGCKRRRIPCPKGGIVLWDSRLFHANARPVEGRQHPDRWRFVVFVCMGPAAWASPSDLEVKRRAYEEQKLTTHWPSEEVYTFPTFIKHGKVKDPIESPDLPEAAKTDDAKRLVGILPYDEEEDGSVVEGPESKMFRPKWNREQWAFHKEEFEKGNAKNKPREGRKAAFKAR